MPFQGSPVSLEAMLNRREARSRELEAFAKAYPQDCLVCLKLNIPGPVKDHPRFEALFQEGVDEFINLYPEAQELSRHRGITGSEITWRLVKEAQGVKKDLVTLEEAYPRYRLFDFDVMVKGQAISRQDLNLPERHCLICHQPAKVCGRSRSHDLPTLLSYLDDLLP